MAEKTAINYFLALQALSSFTFALAVVESVTAESSEQLFAVVDFTSPETYVFNSVSFQAPQD